MKHYGFTSIADLPEVPEGHTRKYLHTAGEPTFGYEDVPDVEKVLAKKHFENNEQWLKALWDANFLEYDIDANVYRLTNPVGDRVTIQGNGRILDEAGAYRQRLCVAQLGSLGTCHFPAWHPIHGSMGTLYYHPFE